MSTSMLPAKQQIEARGEPKPAPRLDIQGLRALAVLVVVADHLFRWPSGGFIGVDVFFVISGFLITGILLREYERTGRISFGGFYSRRVKRIIPASVLVLFVTVMATLALYGTERFSTVLGDGIASFLFVANWRYAAQGTDYFQVGAPPSPLQHFWSLAVEEQFYFVWPWLLLLVLLLGARLFGLRREHGRLVAGLLIGGITVATFLWAMRETAETPEVAYFSSFSRAWELGVGASLAAAAPLLRISSVWLRTLLGWTGLAGIIASLFLVSAEANFPAPWAALPVLSTGLVILAGIGGPQPWLFPLTNRPANYIGDISYSLYLWHFPVIILLPALLQVDTWSYYTGAIILMAALSTLSFHQVEERTRHAVWFESAVRGSSATPGWGYVGLVTAGIFALFMSAAVFIQAKPVVVVDESLVEVKTIKAIDTDSCLGAHSRFESNDCELNSTSDVFPSPAEALTDSGGYECWIDTAEPMDVCSYGSNAEDALNVAVVGDSHAESLLPGLWPYLVGLNWHVDAYSGVECQWWAEPTEQCTARPDIQAALEAGGYDLVITATARFVAPSDTEWAAQQYVKAWKPVAQGGARIVAIEDWPVPSEQSIACISRLGFDPKKADCSTPLDEAFARTDPLPVAAASVEGAASVNLLDFFCTDAECPAVVGNVVVFRDTAGHATATFTRTLGPYLINAIADAADLELDEAYQLG